MRALALAPPLTDIVLYVLCEYSSPFFSTLCADVYVRAGIAAVVVPTLVTSTPPAPRSVEFRARGRPRHPGSRPAPKWRVYSCENGCGRTGRLVHGPPPTLCTFRAWLFMGSMESRAFGKLKSTEKTRIRRVRRYTRLSHQGRRAWLLPVGGAAVSGRRARRYSFRRRACVFSSAPHVPPFFLHAVVLSEHRLSSHSL
jgi:hypothetical protein